MSRLFWVFVELACRLLRADERDAVRGDIAESGESGWQALNGVVGLLVRRQLGLWTKWEPWLALVGVAGFAAILISPLVTWFDGGLSIQIDTYLRHGVHYETGVTVLQDVIHLSCLCLGLFFWTWTSSFVLGSLSGRALWLTWAAFYIVVLDSSLVRSLVSGEAVIYHAPPLGHIALIHLLPLGPTHLIFLITSIWAARRGARLRVPKLPEAIRLATTVFVLTLLLTWTSGWYGTAHENLTNGAWRSDPWPARMLPLLLVGWPVGYMLVASRRRRMSGVALCGVLLLCAAQAQADIRQRSEAVQVDAVTPESNRKAAPGFALIDAAGKRLVLSDYKGKVVLLDFWATWCHGCKLEIPWYVEFDRKYRHKGLAVIGVAMDEEGMKIVKPFLAAKQIGYPVVIGNDTLARAYNLQSMPMTLLIDRQGRVALSHSGVVDKKSFEIHIQELLTTSKRK